MPRKWSHPVPCLSTAMTLVSMNPSIVFLDIWTLHRQLLLLFEPHWQHFQHEWDRILPTAAEVQQADATQLSLLALYGRAGRLTGGLSESSRPLPVDSSQSPTSHCQAMQIRRRDPRYWGAFEQWDASPVPQQRRCLLLDGTTCTQNCLAKKEKKGPGSRTGIASGLGSSLALMGELTGPLLRGLWLALGF